jgi:hypothetical protein
MKKRHSDALVEQVVAVDVIRAPTTVQAPR